MGFRRFFILIVMIIIVMGWQVASEADVKAAKEIRLRLSTLIDDSTSKRFEAQASPGYRVTVIEKRLVPGPPPRQRNPQLSSQHLVVIGFDAQGREITRIVIADPRLVRAETFGPTGEIISSELMYQKNVEFSVVLPDDSRIKQLGFYHPHWTGTEFELELIGETQLR